MIALVAGLVGAVVGGLTAKRRKGSAADIAQYAAGYGIAFGVAGVFGGLLLEHFVFS
ncbi:MAG: apolipoprotein acyltransferase [Roseovarius sp.]|uniref:apolipoprotein acyltransferase n=1 Tax=Roseovarius sp. TaxID=1486281 RepID=UPI0032EFF636